MSDLLTRLRELDGEDRAPVDLADRALRRAHGRRVRRRTLTVAATAAAAALLVGAVNMTAGRLTAPEPAAPPATRQNVLVVGVDDAPGRVGSRPDTIMLASIAPDGRTTVFGFPRDLRQTPFPAGSPAAQQFPNGFSCASGSDDPCLLNALWEWAEGPGRKNYPGDAQPGLTATRQGVEELSGLPVTDTVVLTMKGLQQTVDALGGVRVDVRERLPIGGNPATGWIEAGRDQRLDGHQALWYARSRWSTDAYDRMRRQQCLAAALLEQAEPVSVALSWKGIARGLRGNLRTSIAPSEVEAWMDVARRVQRSGVRTVSFTDQTPGEIRQQVSRSIEPGTASSSGGGDLTREMC